MSLDVQEAALVKGNLTSWLLTFESSTDKSMKKRMHKKLEGCYDVAIHHARKSAQKALGYHMLHNTVLSESWELEATKWRAVADEVLKVIELVNDGGQS